MVGDLSAIQRDVALLLGKVDNIERMATEGQELPDDTVLHGGVMLDRFLNECRSDAQTVLDNIEYQQDHDFEDVWQHVPAEVSESHPESRPEVTSSSQSPTILFRNSLDYERLIPLEQCSTRTVRELPIWPVEAARFCLRRLAKLTKCNSTWKR